MEKEAKNKDKKKTRPKRKRDETEKKASGKAEKAQPAAKKLKTSKAAKPKPQKKPVVTRVPMGAASSNWQELKKKIAKPKVKPHAKPKSDKEKATTMTITTTEKTSTTTTTTITQTTSTQTEKPVQKPGALPPPKFQNDKSLTKYIALDCEMVGIGIDGRESMLARVCVVNSHGNIIYDKHVKPREAVVDFRTKYSGIRAEDLKDAVDFETVQKEVAEMTRGRIVVGHGLENDFKALLLDHPFSLTRDTAKYRPFQRSRGKPSALRYLAQKILGVTIQSGEHTPDEDARTALLLYKFARKEWEAWLQRRTGRQQMKAKRKLKKQEQAKNTAVASSS